MQSVQVNIPQWLRLHIGASFFLDMTGRGPTGGRMPVDDRIGALVAPQWPLIRHRNAAIWQRLGECLRFDVVSLRGKLFK